MGNTGLKNVEMKLYRAIFFSVALLFFCMTVTYSGEGAYPPEKDYLKLSEEQINIAEISLVIAKKLNPEIDIERYLSTIDKMAAEIEPEVRKAHTPEVKIKVINDYLFKKKKFEPVQIQPYGYLNRDEFSPKALFLNDVLDSKKGSCFGLSGLYLSLAERLGLPIYPVLIPTHVFVRYDDGDVKINIETIKLGVCVTDDEYISNKKISESSLRKQLYMKNITKKEFAATMINKRGNYYCYVLGDYDEAYEDFKTANEILKSPETYYNISTVFLAREQYDRAVEPLLASLALDETFWLAWANLAKCYQETERPDEAVNCCNKAIALSDDSVNIYATRASCYLKMSEPAKAIEDYKRVQELGPNFTGHFNNLAIAYAMQGDLSRAIEVISNGILKEPNNAMYYHLRAVFHSDENDFDAFIKDAKAAVKIIPAIKEKIRGNPRFDKWREKKAFQEFLR